MLESSSRQSIDLSKGLVQFNQRQATFPVKYLKEWKGDYIHFCFSFFCALQGREGRLPSSELKSSAFSELPWTERESDYLPVATLPHYNGK